MIENNLYKDTRVERVMAAIYLIVALVGSYPIVQMKIMGLVPTYYRVLVPIVFIYFIVERLRKYREIKCYTKPLYLLVGVLIVMMGWGTALLFTGEYVDKAEGMKGLLSLGLGLLSIIIVYEMSHREGGYSIIINTIRIVIVALTVFALFEMATGNHLAGSKFSDPKFIDAYIRVVGELHDGKVSYCSTAVFYNENDFSAFIGLFAPVFFPQGSYSRKINGLLIAELGLILTILSQNDAWICMFAPLVGSAAYLLITRANIKIWVVAAVGFAAVEMFGVKVFGAIVYAVYTILPGVKVPFGIATMFHDGGSKLPAAINGQMEGVANSSGSAFSRTHTYIEGIKDTLFDSHGLGFGPGSYTNYVKASADPKMLLNPHSMWLEIIMQYGIIVALLFIGVLVYLYIKLCINYHNTHRREYAVIIAIDTIFVLICFAPSRYFGLEYMWIVLGLSVAFASISLNSIKEGASKLKKSRFR